MPLIESLSELIPANYKPSIGNVLHNVLFGNVKWAIHHVTQDMFSYLEIQTVTECNRSCPICPVSSDPIEEAFMEEGLFKKIIGEVGEIGFNGRISPHFYGEPLLDERLPRLMKYAKEKIPESKIIIFTNGDLLTKKKLEELLDNGVDGFLVTQYNGKGLRLLNELEPEQRRRISYKVLSDRSYLFNRGGLVSPKRVRRMNRCFYPSDSLVIDFKGNVVLCCNDYHSNHVFGNLQSEDLVDVLNKDEYKKIRRETRVGNFSLDICKVCTGKN